MLAPVSTDQSLGILNKLFGTTNWQSLYGQAIGISPGSVGTFFHLLSAFDTVVFGFVALFITYITAISVMSTAHSGKAMGERYHTLWTPIRSAVAMILLAPIPGVGISAIQGILLMFVYFSIGGANLLATTATEYMAAHGGALSALTPQGGTRLAEDILQSMTTQHFFVTFEAQNTTENSMPVFTPANAIWTQGIAAATGPAPEGEYVYTFSVPAGFQSGQFGRIVIPCETQKGPMCTAKVAAIQQIAGTLLPYVQEVVNSAEAPAGATTVQPPTTGSAPTPTPAPPLAQAAEQYDAAVAAAVPAEIQVVSPRFAQAMSQLNQAIAHEGWVSLGSYYWQIGSANKALQKRVDAAPGWTGYDAQAIGQSLGRFDQQRLAGILSEIAGAQVAANPRQPTGLWQAAVNRIFPVKAGAWYAQPPAALLLNGDPIANLQRVGDDVMNAEGPIVGAYMLDRMTVGGASRIGKGIPVVSGLIDLAGGVARTAERVFGPYLMMIVVSLTIIAAVWAYYIPAVPFILWTFGVVGWLILVIEALVASVLWAAGIATPEGEGLIGQKGEQGFQLFLNVMIRPSLMVLGFFASFLLIDSVGNWVGAGISIFFAGENTGITAWNPLTWISSAALIAVIAVMLSHKIFALITWVPDNVMRWVGHGVTPLGEHESEKQTRQAFVGVAGSAGKIEKKAGQAAAARDEKKLPAPGAGGRGEAPADHGEKS